MQFNLLRILGASPPVRCRFCGGTGGKRRDCPYCGGLGYTLFGVAEGKWTPINQKMLMIWLEFLWKRYNYTDYPMEGGECGEIVAQCVASGKTVSFGNRGFLHLQKTVEAHCDNCPKKESCSEGPSVQF